MYKDKTIGVVVPAYNEEILIARVIETMPEFVDKNVMISGGDGNVGSHFFLEAV
jgi:hypothetical protein